MIRKMVVFVAMIILVWSSLSAITFEREYSTSMFASNICQTFDGFAVTGLKQDDDLWLKKFDAWGNPLWEKEIFAQPGQDYGSSIKETADKKLMIAGCSAGANFTALIVRTDSAGNVLNSKKWLPDGFGSAGLYDIVETDDNSYIAVGYAISDSDTFFLYIVKVNEELEIQWEKFYRYEEKGFRGRKILKDGSDYIILAISNHDFLLVKIDTNGNIILAKRYGPHAPQHLSTAGATNLGIAEDGYLITGYTDVSPSKPYLFKTNENADSVWFRGFSTPQYGEGSACWQTETGNYITIAKIGKDYLATYRIKIYNTDEAGNIIWERTYDGDTLTKIRGACQARDGGAIILAMIADFSTPWRLYLVKTDANGNVGIKENTIASQIKSVRVFPNPTKGKINFVNKSSKPIELKIYNITGRMVKKIKISKKAKIYLQSGVYFWKTKNQTGKIIVIK